MTDEIVCIDEENVSVAWAEAFLRVMERGVTELAPLIVRVTGLADGVVPEDTRIREALERTLAGANVRLGCDTVSRTIFPHSLWDPSKSRAELYRRYSRILPRLRRYRGNERGTYFGRMIAFGDGDRAVNQIEEVINTYQNHTHRRSALQLAIFDPLSDHTHRPRQLFPCLHQVAFGKDGQDGLTIAGFYATQFLFERAYGNYLGLCRLGQFMAHELGLQLRQMQCFVSVAQRGRPNKGDLIHLATELQELLGDRQG